MNSNLKTTLTQVKNFYRELPPARRSILIAVTLFSVISFSIIIFFLSHENHRPLVSGMSSEDVQAITRILKERNIPCRVSIGGDSILVPEGRIDDARLELASSGIPGGSGVGFELFDKTEIGMTTFQEQVNFRRALEGELARTIRSLSAIRHVRVHLVKPKASLFKEDTKEPSASVVLNLNPGAALNKRQISGIRYLCSSAVEGLTPDRVTVLDGRGAILAKSSDGNNDLGAEENTEYQRALEQRMESRIIDLLEPLVGTGKVVAQVTAEVDLRHRTETREEYNPDRTVLRSEQRSSEKREQGEGRPGGVAGSQSNLPGGSPGKQGKKDQIYEKNSETLNYEVDKKIMQTEYSRGSLTRLSAAIVVDGKYESNPDDEAATPTYKARSDEEMAQFSALVKKAIGFTAKRGDAVEVSNVQFTSYADTDIGVSFLDSVNVESTLRIVGLVFLGLLLFLFVIRPALRSFSHDQTEILLQPGRPATVVELEGRLSRMDNAQGQPEFIEAGEQDVAVQVRQLTQGNPHRASQIIQGWLEEDGETPKA